MTPPHPHHPPPVVGVLDLPEYEVEAVLDHRAPSRRRRAFQFLVKWKGLGIGHNEWLSVDDMVDDSDGAHVINAALLDYAQLHPEVKESRPTWDWSPAPEV